jgi:CRP-like cAMP-binding protein
LPYFNGLLRFKSSSVTSIRTSATERHRALPRLGPKGARAHAAAVEFIATLSSSDADLLRSHVKPLHVPQGTFLYKAEDAIERVYFPQTGVISLVVGLTSGQFVEAGMLGRNGVIGAGAPLDGAIALNSAIVQVESSGLAADTAVMKRLVRESETLRISLVRHEQVVSAHTQQVAACNALHELEERLSRWLLQTRDLLKSDTLPLTQEFLSQMLGSSAAASP